MNGKPAMICFKCKMYPCMVYKPVKPGGHKKCRLSWLTNSALVYEPKCGGRGGFAGSQPMSTAVHNVQLHMEPK